MSVNSYLMDLGSNLVLSSEEKSSIKTSLSAIFSRLVYFGLDIVEKKVYGSYVRETILPRKADENSDVDIMIVFANPLGYKPQTFLNKLRQFTEFYYPRSVVKQSRPSIVLELNHIKFELTPAYIYYGSYYIPWDSSLWMITDPDGFYNTLTECNKVNGFKIKPIIRLLKHWNIQRNKRGCESFELEKRIATDLRSAYYFHSSYTDYLTGAFDTILYCTDFANVNKAKACISQALYLEKQGYVYHALDKIKEVFPEV